VLCSWPMIAITPNRRHGWPSRIAFFSGYFLLISSASTFGSAGVLSYRAHAAKTRWTEATAHVRNCSIGVYDSTFKMEKGKLYALRCELIYQIGGRPYRNSFHSDFTRSTQVRSDIIRWISAHRYDDLNVRVNPKEPWDYYVETPLPVNRRRDNADTYIYAGFVFAAAGLTLNAIGRRLARAEL
jgi:hypothetical protein